MCVSALLAYMYYCVHAWCPQRPVEALELDLGISVSCHVAARSQTCMFYKSSKGF